MDLNPTQSDVLKWVADGSPDGVFDGYTHRISAAALRSRGLISVSGRGPTWQASITPRGAETLEALNAPRTTNGSVSTPRKTEVAAVSDAETPPSQGKPRRLAPTEQLIADLLAAGGVMRVPYWPAQGERNYRQLINAAQRWNKVPEGKRLVTAHERGEMEIRLVDASEASVIAPLPVSVPAGVAKPHPVAREYRNDAAHHLVSRAQLSRCVRIIHALATECERRGYAVRKLSSELPEAHGYGRRSMKGGSDFDIILRDHRYPFHLFEEKVPLRGAWEQDQRFRKSDYYTRQLGIEPRIGRYDKDGTGRLTLSLDGYNREGRQASWGDRRSWRLEDKLGEILREVEVRAVEDDHRAEEERRKADERQRQWELSMERAKERYVDSYSGNALREHAIAWREANDLRVYLAALEDAHGANPDAADWIEWARGYIERLDPLNRPQSVPTAEEPTADDLKPFLGGVSPYGPRGW